MFEAALGTAITFIVLLTYFDLRKVAGFAVILDIGIFALMFWLFEGTYAGVMTGFIAGLIITLFLRGIRRFMGYKTPTVVVDPTTYKPRIEWRLTPPGKP